MRQTISGETPKVSVNEKKEFKDFLKNEKISFEKYSESVFLYNALDKPVQNIYNYLNTPAISLPESELKKIIKKEFDNSENLFPYLGNVYLSKLFSKDIVFKNKKIKLDKKSINQIIENFKYQESKDICNLFINNCSKKYNVSLEKNLNTNNIIVEKNNNLTFDNKFDQSFFTKNSYHFKNFNYFLINGHIDNVSEIHHILQKSSEERNIDYIIFCMGVSPEVSNTIRTNNARKITRVYPISFDFIEENINIMSDMSVLMSSDVISADRGQTISQAFISQKNIGKSLTIKNNTFTLEQNCTKEELLLHVNVLKQKCKNTDNDVNKKYILKRIKNLSNKKFLIYLPKDYYEDLDFIKEINYFFSIFSNSNDVFTSLKNKKTNNVYFLPIKYYNLILQKIDSNKKIINDLEKIILNKC